MNGARLNLKTVSVTTPKLAFFQMLNVDKLTHQTALPSVIIQLKQSTVS